MSKTNTRLQILVDEIDDAQSIADIGTDHGYLPIMAIRQHKAQKAYASDIATGPLAIAKKNIKEAKLIGQITVLQSDGLAYYKDNNVSLDYAIIAGLGSLTISEILEKDYQGIDTYIICSNTEPSAILKVAKHKRLRVVKEEYFLDKSRKYWMLKLNKKMGLKIKSFKDIYVGMDSVLKSKEYLELLTNKYKENEDHLLHQKKWSKRYRFLKKLNKNIKEVLEDGTRKNS